MHIVNGTNLPTVECICVLIVGNALSWRRRHSVASKDALLSLSFVFLLFYFPAKICARFSSPEISAINTMQNNRNSCFCSRLLFSAIWLYFTGGRFWGHQTFLSKPPPPTCCSKSYTALSVEVLDAMTLQPSGRWCGFFGSGNPCIFNADRVYIH